MKNTLLQKLLVLVAFLAFHVNSFAQTKTKIAILGIDAKGIVNTKDELNSLVRVELEKLKKYEIIDRYDQNEVLVKNKINVDECLGKTCQINAGKLLNCDKTLSGSVQRIAEKIIVSFSLYDIKTEQFEKTQLVEFINLETEIQQMVRITLQKLHDIPTDKQIEDQLVSYNETQVIPKTLLKLNGPRIGVGFTGGDNGKRLRESRENGGFDMFPVMSQFGWQQEFKYLSAGNFQGLIEFIFLGSGLETGRFVPSLSLLNGFRNSKTGIEFAIGPSFLISKVAEGFYDDNGLYGPVGKWYLENELRGDSLNPVAKIPYTIVTRPDSRGDLKLTSSLVIGVGKTFRSGYLNIPVNFFFSPRKTGSLYGISFGFNINKQK